MLNAARRKHITAIAMFAMLFGALSPAFAAIKYSGHPEVLAQICTTHGLSSNVSDNQQMPSGKSHAGHQIHCAWCSASASQPGIGGTPVQIALSAIPTQDSLAPAATVPASSAPIAAYNPQAPPVLV